MIGKAKSCMGGFSLYNYVIDQAKGFEILRNQLCGETPQEIMEEMKIIQSLNQKATNKLFSMVLSPDISDGKKLSKEELSDLTHDFLKELGFNPDKEQFLAFVHTEKEHKHIHILMNRVKIDGKLHKDHHIGKKAQWAAHRTAEKHKLISAKQIQIDKIKDKDNEKIRDKEIRKEIFRKHRQVSHGKSIKLKDYISQMRKLGVEVKPVVNKQKKLQGLRFKDLESGKDFKASDVHRSMGLKSLLEAGLIVEGYDLIDVSKNTQKKINSDFNSVKYETTHTVKNNKSKLAELMEIALESTYASTENELTKKKKRKGFRR